MGTKSSIGCVMSNGKIAYVECRYDGYLSHVGLLLTKQYNTLDKIQKLLQDGNIVSLREDLEHTERESSLGYDKLEDRVECEVKESN